MLHGPWSILRIPVLLFLVALSPAAAQGPPAPKTGPASPPAVPAIQVRPIVSVEETVLRVGAEGLARLPDGAILVVDLAPLGDRGEAGPTAQSTRVEVKQGAFTTTPWTMARAEMKALRYRIAARLADGQNPELERRLPRTARVWSASVDVALGDWRARCGQLVPIARLLLERLEAVTRHRDALVVMARDAGAKRLPTSAWEAWKKSSGAVRDREQFALALASPKCAVIFPRSCDKGRNMLSRLASLFAAIESEARGGKGAGNPEMLDTLKVADHTVPSNYQLDFEAALEPEGILRMVEAVEEIMTPLLGKPGKPEAGGADAPPPVPRPALLAAERALKDVAKFSAGFQELGWHVDAQERHGALLELIGQGQHLVERLPELGSVATPEDPRTAMRQALDRLKQSLTSALNK